MPAIDNLVILFKLFKLMQIPFRPKFASHADKYTD